MMQSILGLIKPAGGEVLFEGQDLMKLSKREVRKVRPKFIVFDEAVSALDVSIQAQILSLLTRLRADMNLTSLFITHNMNVVHHLADRVAIMCLGKIVEMAPVDDLFAPPLHARPAVGHPGSRPAAGAAAPAARPRRGPAQPGRPAERLPLPHPSSPAEFEERFREAIASGHPALIDIDLTALTPLGR